MAGNLIAENRRARFDYFLEQTFEAGLSLTGSEVKSLRNGRANIAESYAAVEGDQIMLVNADIPPYTQANRLNHEPRRPRKLLLHRDEIRRLKALVDTERVALVPMSLYFRDGRVKVELGVGKGRTKGDKRQAIAARDAARDIEREVRRANKYG